MFRFGSDQTLFKTVKETSGNISIEVVRKIAFYGQVTIEWEIIDVNGSRAVEDFIEPFGSLVFDDKQQEKVNMNICTTFLYQIRLFFLCFNALSGNKEP